MSYRFNEKCNGCSACVDQCPVAAIKGEFRARYEVVSHRCIDCGVCGMISDEEAVLDETGTIAARIPRNQRPRPQFNLEMCNGCGLCVDFCPPACLSLVGSPHSGVSLLHEPLACISCGECASICMKGAVSMSAPDLATLNPEAEQERCKRILDVYLEV